MRVVYARVLSTLILFIFSLILTYLSYQKLGFWWFLLFYLAYIAFILRAQNHLKHQSTQALLVIASIAIIGSPPLFENDHYRYLWEGKVVSMGLSPINILQIVKS